jgi:STE24 endopeptidase
LTPLSNNSLPEKAAPEPVLNPARQRQARHYARLKRRLSLAELLVGGGLLAALIFGGLSDDLAGLFNLSIIPAAVIYAIGLPAAVIYAIGLMLAYQLLTAPLSYYGGYVLPRRYGLSTQGLGGWLNDIFKAVTVALLLGLAMLAAVYWFITTWPDAWWLLTWGLGLVASALITVLAPLFLVPLFFTMKPLADDELKERLEALAERAKVAVGGIYVIEFSAKGTMANAALMGWGQTRRVVLSDTLLKAYSPEEIEVIMAHEIAHHRHNDIYRLFVVRAAILLVTFFFTGLIFEAAVASLGFSGISDVAALPLLALIFGGLNLLTSPLASGYSRRIEAAADSYALELTGDARSFINAMTRLTDQNLGEAAPSRWVENLLYDHPSYASRVAYAGSFPARKADQEGKQ